MTPAGTSNELDVQNGWEDNTHIHNGFVFVFVWCPCMAIDVSVPHNGGFLPGINTVDPVLLPSGKPSKCHGVALYLQPMIPPKRFDIFFPLAEGCSARCIQIFL